jgi:hypothetical protein
LYVLHAQAYCAWKTAQDGQLVRYRVITEAEHQLIRNTRDRSDAYLIGSGAGAPTAAVAGGVVVSGDKAAGGKAAGKAINISVTIGGAGAAVAAPRADNVDMVMKVSGQNAAKVGQVAVGGWGWRHGTGGRARACQARDV